MNSKTKQREGLKEKAIILRRQGRTFSEIQAEIGSIPKSTLSNWLKNIELTNEQTLRIKQVMFEGGHSGRYAGSEKNRQLRIERLAHIQKAAASDYLRFHVKPAFLAGLTLYLAEGSKKTERFMFMNSDPYLMKCMVEWAEKYGEVKRENMRFRLYIHHQYADENCELFWENRLKAKPEQFLKTVYKPSERVYKKNPAYKGCLRMEVLGSELYWRTMAWRTCFYDSIG